MGGRTHVWYISRRMLEAGVCSALVLLSLFLARPALQLVLVRFRFRRRALIPPPTRHRAARNLDSPATWTRTDAPCDRPLPTSILVPRHCAASDKLRPQATTAAAAAQAISVPADPGRASRPLQQTRRLHLDHLQSSPPGTPLVASITATDESTQACNCPLLAKPAASPPADPPTGPLTPAAGIDSAPSS